MSFYENTLIAKQDLPKSELDKIKEKYSDLIKNSSGKIIKIEEWGLMNLATKIKKYIKGFYIHYKFEGNKETLEEINKKIKIDGSIIRHLIVKYKSLDIKNEYFKRVVSNSFLSIPLIQKILSSLLSSDLFIV